MSCSSRKIGKGLTIHMAVVDERLARNVYVGKQFGTLVLCYKFLLVIFLRICCIIYHVYVFLIFLLLLSKLIQVTYMCRRMILCRELL